MAFDWRAAVTLFFFRPAFERYTFPVRESIFRAVKEAQRDGCSSLTAEYLVLGLVRQDAEELKACVRCPDIEALVNDLRQPGRADATPHQNDLVVSKSAKAVFRAAEELADARTAEVGLLQLLGGALKTRAKAAQVLGAHGITFTDVAEALSRPDSP